MEQDAYRHVPYDIEIEQALLGAILVDNQALERVGALIKPEHFYDPLHARIFETMAQAFERGSFVLTPLTLHAAMKADPGLIEVGGVAYLAGLASAAPAMPNVRDYARILHDLAVRRSLIRIGEDIVNTAYEAPTEKGPQAQIKKRKRRSMPSAKPANMARARWISTRRCAGRWNRRKRRRSAAAGFPASPPALPISTICWAACSRRIC